MKNPKYIFILTVIISSLLFSNTIAYVTETGAGIMDGTSWSNAFPGDSLFYAAYFSPLNANEVWVAKGIYKPVPWSTNNDDKRASHFAINGIIKFYGGFAGNETDISQRSIQVNETILSGDIGVEGDPTDNCYHVIQNGEYSCHPDLTLIDGFTIQDGYADGPQWDGNSHVYHNYGGGMINYRSAPTSRNCTFRNNYAIGVGGAIAVYYNDRTSIVIQNCLFYDNEAGRAGGAIWCADKRAFITNSTIVNNRADEAGGLYLIYGDGPIEITNNIIWGNEAEQLLQGTAFETLISHNAIEGGYDGFENIELASSNDGYKNSPFFTDPINNNWTIQSQSACIDKGVYWNTHDVDITNLPVPKGECRDIGAYEYDNGQLSSELPQVTTLAPETVTITTAICKGNIIADGDTQLVARGIFYSTQQNFDPDTIQTKYKLNELLNIGEFSFPISPLDPNTTYYYRAYCENRIGSAYGEEFSFTTLPGANPDASGILYVSTDKTGDGSSWVNALHGNDLQYGISKTSAEEIWVAKGRYIPTNWPCTETKKQVSDTDFSFRFFNEDSVKYVYNGTTEREKHFSLKPNVALYGGFNGTETSVDQRDFRANETILSGDIGIEGDNSDNAYHVIYHYFESDIDSTAIIDGFSISDGNANGGIYGDSYFGGGIFNRCSSPNIRNCTLKNNHAIRGGGIINGYSDDFGYSKPFIYNTKITQNSAEIEGGGIYNIAGYPVIRNCAITQNTAGQLGGGIYHSAEYFEFFIKDTLKINHCTVADNISVEVQGDQILLDIHDSYNHVIVNNSIVWSSESDNPLYQYYYDYYIEANYIAITDGFNCQGSINLSKNNEGDLNSPYFTDPNNNDYSIQLESPCKDNAIYWFKTDEDILGTTRPQGAAYDLGAYEYVTSDTTATVPVIYTSYVENETASTAICHTDVLSNGGSNIIEYGFKFSDIDNFDPEIEGKLQSIKEEVDLPELNMLIGELNSNHKYYYRSYAENRIGYSYGQQEELNTKPIALSQDSILFIAEDGTGDGNSWSNSLNGKDIQAAIEFDGTKQVWIKKGTYHPTSWPADSNYNAIHTMQGLIFDEQIEKHFMLKQGVEIYGGFNGTETSVEERDIRTNETVFSGDIGIENDLTDNISHIFLNVSKEIDLGGGNYSYSIDSTAILDGFTITKGNTIRDFSNIGGAGMYNELANPTIRNCMFSKNQSFYDGGAICNNNGSMNLKMTIENCDFTNNFSKYYGGAIHNYSEWNKLTLLNCKFVNNSTEYFGGAIETGFVTEIRNCLFDRNYAGRNGGAIYLSCYTSGSESKIINTTIANNTAVISGGGISTFYGNTTLTNSAMFNNGEEFNVVLDSDIPNINNCAISSELNFNHTGENNIHISPTNAGDPNSPYFSDPDNGNYMIQVASPLRNAGMWTDDVPLYDLYGFARDTNPDIGCFEYDESSIDDSDELLIMSYELKQNYPNPFNPSTTITFTIPIKENV
ncbi:MAG: hypothetical protein JXR36_02075, partial [Bacteroidales bacterium]|nr:hypothetical protein [Bacteroidales bacterium]